MTSPVKSSFSQKAATADRMTPTPEHQTAPVINCTSSGGGLAGAATPSPVVASLNSQPWAMMLTLLEAYHDRAALAVNARTTSLLNSTPAWIAPRVGAFFDGVT